MVTAYLKYAKKNNNNNPVMRSRSLSNEKKTHTQKITKQNKVNEENKKTKQT